MFRDFFTYLFSDNEVDKILAEIEQHKAIRESIGKQLETEGATITYHECLSITEGNYLDLPGLKAFRLIVKEGGIVIPTEFGPGERVNRHRNDCTKRGLVVSGSLTVDEERYEAGDLFRIDPLTWHVLASEEGCIVVFVLRADVQEYPE